MCIILLLFENRFSSRILYSLHDLEYLVNVGMWYIVVFCFCFFVVVFVVVVFQEERINFTVNGWYVLTE